MTCKKLLASLLLAGVATVALSAPPRAAQAATVALSGDHVTAARDVQLADYYDHHRHHRHYYHHSYRH